MILNFKHKIAGIIALCSLSAAATEINCTPGQLSALLGNDTSVTTLTITGSIDASDLKFINDNCTSLTTLDLSGVSIDAYNGKALTGSRGTYQANVIPAYAFFGSNLRSVTLPSTVTAIETAAFASSAIAEINIPASVKVIGDDTFASCKSLKAVTIPSTAETIGTGVFAGCTSLAEATFEAGATTIPARTFNGDTGLQTVTLPSSLKSIGDEAFMGATALQAVKLPASVTSIGQKAFYDTALTEVNLANNNALDTIGSYAYALCRDLRSVTLPDKSITLGDGVFFDDTALTSVAMPSSLALIPDFTFKGDEGLTSADFIPSSVSQIGSYALMGWSKAKEITLPASLESLGDGAMEQWTSLEKIDATRVTAVPSTGTDVWAGISDPSEVVLFASSSTYNDFKTADQWKDFYVTMYSSSSDNDIAIDGVSGKTAVTFHFENDKLIINSSAQPIVAVEIYDIAGRRHLAVDSRSQKVAIALDRLPDTIFVVNARLADNTSASIKITK